MMESDKLITAKSATSDAADGDDVNEEAVSWRKSKNAVVMVVCAAVFTDIFMFGATLPIQARLLERAGYPGDDTKLTVVFSAYSFGYLLATPVFGVVSDILKDRKVPFLTAFLALVGSCLLFVFGRGYEELVAARALQGVSAAGTWVLGFTMLSDTFPNAILGRKIAIALGFNMAGFVLGPIAGGFLSEYVSLDSPFYVCGVLGCLDVIARVLVTSPNALVKQSTPLSLRGTMKLATDTTVLMVLGAIFLAAASFAVIEARMPEHVETRFGYSESQQSLVLIIFIGSRTLTGMLVGRVVHRQRVMAVGLLLHGLTVPWAFIAPSLPWLVVSGVGFGFTYALAGIPAIPELARAIDDLKVGGSYGSTYAIYNMVYSLGMMSGPFLVSSLYQHFTLFLSLVALAALCIAFACTFGATFKIWRTQKTPTLEEIPI